MRPYSVEIRRLFQIASPVLIAQLAQTAFGLVDSIMCGRVSKQDIAAIGTAMSVWNPILLLGHGLILSLTTVVAQLHGAKKQEMIAHPFRQALWLALFISVPIITTIYLFAPRIVHIPHDPHLTRLTIGYLRMLLWGAPGYLFFLVLRCLNDGISSTKPGMLIAILGLLLNIPINYICIYGKFGLPPLGVVGCGLTTALLNWIMAFSFLYYTLRSRRLQPLKLFAAWEGPSMATLWTLTSIGLPIGLAYFFESSLFSIVGLWLAQFDCIQIAGHVVAMHYSSLAFVFPLSVGISATVRVGYNLGRQSITAARRSGIIAIMTGCTLSIATAIGTLLFRKQIAYVTNPDEQVRILVEALMLLNAIFQCADGLQITATGVLRGYKDTAAIFLCTVISYWGIGLSTSYYLGIVQRMGAIGCWIGFILGISSSALLLIARLHWLQRTSEQILRNNPL